MLLNRRGVVSFEQLLLDISEALGFPRWHKARVTRLYTTHAREVRLSYSHINLQESPEAKKNKKKSADGFLLTREAEIKGHADIILMRIWKCHVIQ